MAPTSHPPRAPVRPPALAPGRCRASVALAVLVLAGAALGAPPVDPLDAPTRSVLSRSLLSADLDGDGGAEKVVLLNRLVGRGKKKAGEFDVQLGVYRPDDTLLWSVSLAELTGGPCFAGEVTLVDLEGNASREILLHYAVEDSAERKERHAVVFRWEQGAGREVWRGVSRLDTRADPGTPSTERTLFEREVDFARTLGAQGRTLFFTKTVRVAAGVELPEARRISEKVALPPRKGEG